MAMSFMLNGRTAATSTVVALKAISRFEAPMAVGAVIVAACPGGELVLYQLSCSRSRHIRWRSRSRQPFVHNMLLFCRVMRCWEPANCSAFVAFRRRAAFESFAKDITGDMQGFHALFLENVQGCQPWATAYRSELTSAAAGPPRSTVSQSFFQKERAVRWACLR